MGWQDAPIVGGGKKSSWQDAPMAEKNSTIDSAARGAGQAYSMGFGDEMLAGLTAPVVYGASRVMDVPGFSDKGFVDTYKQLRDNERQQIKEAESDNPKSYYTGVVAGAVANPAKLTGNIVQQGVKYGVISGLGDSEAESLKGMALDSAEGGLKGAVTGKLLQKTGQAGNAVIKGSQNLVKGFNARGVDALEATAGQIDDVASSAFQSMRKSGTVFNRPRIINITNKVESTLVQDTKLNQRLHGDTMGILDDFKKEARAGDFDFESLHQYRRLFNGVVKKNLMSNPDDARLAKMAISKIDEEIANLKPIDVRGGNVKAVSDLQTGLKEWSKLKKFETISDIVGKSQGDVNYLKRELTKIANNPRKYGFTGDELSALKDAAKLTSGEAVLKVLGKAGFDPARLGSGVGAFFGSTAGGVLGGASGAAAVPIIGTGAKYGQKLVGRGKTERLLDAIETGNYKAPRGVNVSQPVQGAIGRSGAAMSGQLETERKQPIIADPVAQPEAKPQVRMEPMAYQSTEGDYFQKLAQAESGGNPNAKAKTSSASGLYQFTNDTWNASVQRWGKELGVSHKDKNNPEAQHKMVQKLTESNANYIKKQVGIAPDNGQLYLAHFMGAPAAVKLMKNYGTGVSAAQLFPKAAKANQSIFFKNGRPRSVEEVYQVVTSKVGDA